MEKVKIKRVTQEINLVSLTNGVIISYGEGYEMKTLEDAVNLACDIINALNQGK
jgi:hypothetical protein